MKSLKYLILLLFLASCDRGTGYTVRSISVLAEKYTCLKLNPDGGPHESIAICDTAQECNLVCSQMREKQK